MTIIVKISDGFGNQMFQYAFACFLQEKYGEEVKLDISGFANNDYRSLWLEHFTLLCPFATVEELPFPSYVQRRERFLHTLQSVLGKYWYHKVFELFEYQINPLYTSFTVPKFVKQRELWFIPNAVKKKGDYYFGYRQSEKYFPGIRNLIVNSFSLKTSLDERNSNIIQKMQSCTSVVLHIRRGDYIQGWSPRRHPLYPCSLEYYQNAIHYLSTQIEDPTFFVFSDDIEWVKKYLDLPSSTCYIDWNGGENAYKDMWLMTKGKHNIISNSTFSRRGAYLNTYPEKIVIAPKIWFKRSERHSGDIIPEDWIAL